MVGRPQYPRCPKKGQQGQIRMHAGQLEYLDPMTGDFKPAVRLTDIRKRLLREQNPSQYDHDKDSGIDVTDKTTFLVKDKAYGGDRNDRPELLFQIKKPSGIRGQRPSRYSMDGGRIILDGFDNGIRHFDELPIALSSSLKGHDIVWYFRQNEFITLHDLISRMPNGFHDKEKGGLWHNGPPGYNTISMRATRFRKLGGLLEWSNKGSDEKNQKILNIIPQECQQANVNSTRRFRDFNDNEQASLENTGSAPQRARGVNKVNTERGEHPEKKNKSVKKGTAQKKRDDDDEEEEEEEEEEEFEWEESENDKPDGEEDDDLTNDTADNSEYNSEEEDGGTTHDGVKDHHDEGVSKGGKDWQILPQAAGSQSTSEDTMAFLADVPKATSKNSLKRSREAEADESDDDPIMLHPRRKRNRETVKASDEDQGSRQPKRKRTHEEENKESDGEPLAQVRKRQRAGEADNKSQSFGAVGSESLHRRRSRLLKGKSKTATVQKPRVAGATTSSLPLFKAYGGKNATSADERDTLENEGGASDPGFTPDDLVHRNPPDEGAFQAVRTNGLEHDSSHKTSRSVAKKEVGAGKALGSAKRQTPKRGSSRRIEHGQTSEAPIKEDDRDARLYWTAREAEGIISDDPVIAWLANDIARRRQWCNDKGNPVYPVDPCAVKKQQDYRYVWPTIRGGSLDTDIELIKKALAPTRADFERKLGYPPPKAFEEEFESESYNCQYLRLQELYAKSWRGKGSETPQLYRIRAWKGGFEDWEEVYKEDIGRDVTDLEDESVEEDL